MSNMFYLYFVTITQWFGMLKAQGNPWHPMQSILPLATRLDWTMQTPLAVVDVNSLRGRSRTLARNAYEFALYTICSTYFGVF